MNCIFCHKDSSASKSVEHIIPESLGNKTHTLPKGYVCDECNNYFATKIEKKLLEQPYFVSLRFRNEIPTKKNKLVKQKMSFIGTQINSEVTIQFSHNGLLCSFDNEELYQKLQDGKCSQMITPYLPEPECPNEFMSRFLAKCAYEYFLYNVGSANYDACVRECLTEGGTYDGLSPLREYARYGKGKYWEYSQRRIYSEGSMFITKKKNSPLERLFEMCFFTKEYTESENGDISAEIYYILALNGMEYAICLSDNSIHEYLKWIQDNNNRSPLTIDDEQLLDVGLSDVNPLLIKKK